MHWLLHVILLSSLSTSTLSFSIGSTNLNGSTSVEIKGEDESNVAGVGADGASKRHIPFPIPYPIHSKEYLRSEESLHTWFNAFIDSTSYFERTASNKFTIPLFDASITLKKQRNTHVSGKEDCYDHLGGDYVIEIAGANKKDYGIIAAKFYESQIEQSVNFINNGLLRQIVKKHFQSLKPNPGTDASLNINNEILDDIISKDIIATLQKRGFATIDTNLITNGESVEKLSKMLHYKTSQDSGIRSDTVAFISKEDALECGIGMHFDALMGIAHYFNENMNFEDITYDKDAGDSESPPRLPATIDRPLTNPTTLQIAEYAFGEFYVAHSDNLLLTSENARSNYRRWTAILYFNDEWDATRDGGALRIYPDTINLTDPEEAAKTQMNFEDVNPSNGKLLIFDSRLVHSVEKVLSKGKKRIAMTLWINKPVDSVTAVNIWDDENSKVDWYRLP